MNGKWQRELQKNDETKYIDTLEILDESSRFQIFFRYYLFLWIKFDTYKKEKVSKFIDMITYTYTLTTGINLYIYTDTYTHSHVYFVI